MLYTVYFNGKSLSTILPKENFLDQETFLFTLQRNACHGRTLKKHAALNATYFHSRHNIKSRKRCNRKFILFSYSACTTSWVMNSLFRTFYAGNNLESEKRNRQHGR